MQQAQLPGSRSGNGKHGGSVVQSTPVQVQVQAQAQAHAQIGDKVKDDKIKDKGSRKSGKDGKVNVNVNVNVSNGGVNNNVDNTVNDDTNDDVVDVSIGGVGGIANYGNTNMNTTSDGVNNNLMNQGMSGGVQQQMFYTKSEVSETTNDSNNKGYYNKAPGTKTFSTPVNNSFFNSTKSIWDSNANSCGKSDMNFEQRKNSGNVGNVGPGGGNYHYGAGGGNGVNDGGGGGFFSSSGTGSNALASMLGINLPQTGGLKDIVGGGGGGGGKKHDGVNIVGGKSRKDNNNGSSSGDPFPIMATAESLFSKQHPTAKLNGMWGSTTEEVASNDTMLQQQQQQQTAAVPMQLNSLLQPSPITSSPKRMGMEGSQDVNKDLDLLRSLLPGVNINSDNGSGTSPNRLGSLGGWDGSAQASPTQPGDQQGGHGHSAAPGSTTNGGGGAVSTPWGGGGLWGASPSGGGANGGGIW
jgi:hypothetical protein